MTTTADIVSTLEQIAPLRLAEDWDNVGLLVGDERAAVTRVMTCLTLTPDSVREAVEQGAQLVVTHHPLPFRPIKRLTTATVEGRMLLDLIRAGAAVYSPHTAFDSAALGINRRLAEGLDLTGIEPLQPDDADPAVGAGRVASPAGKRTLAGLARSAQAMLGLEGVRVVGADEDLVTRVALACGSGASLLETAIAAGCDAFVTGEASFHSCLAAESAGVALVLLGHYASERFAVEALAGQLASDFPSVEVWASRAEHDPLRFAGTKGP